MTLNRNENSGEITLELNNKIYHLKISYERYKILEWWWQRGWNGRIISYLRREKKI